MTLEQQEVVLARRQADVNARPKVPDPREVQQHVDASRQRQLAARQGPQSAQSAPEPSQDTVSEAKGGDPASEAPPTDYSKVGYQKLRRMASERDLDVPGQPKKDELIAALEADDTEEN